MYRIQRHDEPIPWPVRISIPQGDGQTATADFTAHFLLIGQAEMRQLARLGDQELMARVLKGWQDVQDEAGQPLEFSDEARGALVDIPYVGTALGVAYLEFAAGARRKNS